MKKREFLKEKPQGNFFIVEVKIEKQFGSNVSLRHLNTQIFSHSFGVPLCVHTAPEKINYKGSKKENKSKAEIRKFDSQIKLEFMRK